MKQSNDFEQFKASVETLRDHPDLFLDNDRGVWCSVEPRGTTLKIFARIKAGPAGLVLDHSSVETEIKNNNQTAELFFRYIAKDSPAYMEMIENIVRGHSRTFRLLSQSLDVVRNSPEEFFQVLVDEECKSYQKKMGQFKEQLSSIRFGEQQITQEEG